MVVISFQSFKIRASFLKCWIYELEKKKKIEQAVAIGHQALQNHWNVKQRQQGVIKWITENWFLHALNYQD